MQEKDGPRPASHDRTYLSLSLHRPARPETLKFLRFNVVLGRPNTIAATAPVNQQM
jgi:hypothetical protein